MWQLISFYSWHILLLHIFLPYTPKNRNRQLLSIKNLINPCPAKLELILFFENTVDPDQLASDEAI